MPASKPRLNMFNSVSLDGYFTDASNDMSWAHAGGDDAEFQKFVAGSANLAHLSASSPPLPNSTSVYSRAGVSMGTKP